MQWELVGRWGRAGRQREELKNIFHSDTTRHRSTPVHKSSSGASANTKIAHSREPPDGRSCEQLRGILGRVNCALRAQECRQSPKKRIQAPPGRIQASSGTTTRPETWAQWRIQALRADSAQSALAAWAPPSPARPMPVLLRFLVPLFRAGLRSCGPDLRMTNQTFRRRTAHYGDAYLNLHLHESSTALPARRVPRQVRMSPFRGRPPATETPYGVHPKSNRIPRVWPRAPNTVDAFPSLSE